MDKIANFPPAFQLSILLNGNHYFCTAFASLEDLANKEVWQAGCDRLHYQLVEWLKENA
jgi:hypothetical protein